MRMTKCAAILLAAAFLCTLLILGCEKEKSEAPPFADTVWTRDGEHDTETLRFGSDGSFHYSCACGNPVNDSDLCEGYRFDAKNGVITLSCLEETDDMITEIRLVKCDEKELQLDFDGEIRVFQK